jgi:hypothetical protein
MVTPACLPNVTVDYIRPWLNPTETAYRLVQQQLFEHVLNLSKVTFRPRLSHSVKFVSYLGDVRALAFLHVVFDKEQEALVKIVSVV